ncbi:ABC transporter substrate-binding protein [Ferrovibrio sp.]|uniref:ABC transporter substrate-binding protein n=1 Tax=Ferrovibrio sp. TaxID=1917215 RepID=UPI001B7B6BCF|nr:ABC transporter substrate-binding protein [Ferrovibrio sp.]MBP7063883.1 ABC transporter substrate-binding protein [Ferrovibrio sp.]
MQHKIFGWAAGTLLLAAATIANTALAGSITVYTALEEDEIADYVAQAKKDIPDVTVNVLRLSTGDLGARILAEAGNPQHDVIWGWAVTNMMDPRVLALVEPYAAKGSEKMGAAYVAADKKWFAATGYIGAFCVNTERLKQKNLPMPKSWADLLNPAFKGEIAMPNPVSSGTGYLQIVSILQNMGEEKGWAFLKQLDGNVNQYIKSGSRPCRQARAGEFAIGTSLAFAAIKSIEEGFPLAMVLPAEGAGYELEASGLMAASKNKADAKKFLDWTLSANAAGLYGKYKELVTLPGFKPGKVAREAGMPEDPGSILYKMDFAASAQQRDAILARWNKEIGR